MADIHAEPSWRSTVLAEVRRGTQIRATGRSGTWYSVRMLDGTVGWLSAKVLIAEK
ncbi:SH3 domain-containing protein [Devosia sp.]|uniref:SH3 domain-containing protein n=1 Tax=Devosia sp. TaxID=1871048 RepID=UPI00344F13B2